LQNPTRRRVVIVDIRPLEQLASGEDGLSHALPFKVRKSEVEEGVVPASLADVLSLGCLSETTNGCGGILPDASSPVIVNSELNASIIVA